MGTAAGDIDAREMLRAVTSINTKLAEQGPTTAVFELLLDELLRVTDSGYGFIGHLVRGDAPEPFLKTRAISNIAWTDELCDWFAANAPSGLEFKNNDTLFGHTVRTGEWVITNDPDGHPSSAGRPEGHPPLRSYMGIPMFCGAELVGMTGLANRPAGYDQKLAALIAPLVMTTSQALRLFIESEARRGAEARLRESEERLRLALDGADRQVWDITLEDEASYFGPDWLAYLAIAFAKPDGGFGGNVHPEDRTRLQRVIIEHLVGASDKVDVEFRTRRGFRWRWVSLTGAVVERGSALHPRRIVGTVQDISRQKKHEDQLRQALDDAQAATQAKSDFLSMMSHEIRTPMNGVLGMVQLLADGELTPDQADQVATIKDSSASLLRILNDVLDFSKIESGKLEFEDEVFDPTRAAIDTARLMRAEAERKGLTFSVELPAANGSNPPLAVRADQARLRQIVLNLLSNAIKFTERGSVTLRLYRHHDDVHLSVTDTGIGIPKDQRDRLFDAFAQADASTNRRFGGTGLGLTISRRLARGMGGDLVVRGNPDGGSIFSVRLPAFAGRIERSTDHAATVDAEVTLDCDLAPDPVEQLRRWAPRVLVAEDNAINQRVVSSMLRKLGASVEVVPHGRAALEAVQGAHDPFDVVLMDGQMPEMDGYDATEAIRTWERDTGAVRTPIVALTASTLNGERERCLALGMDDFLPKPLVRGALVMALHRVVGRARTLAA